MGPGATWCMVFFLSHVHAWSSGLSCKWTPRFTLCMMVLWMVVHDGSLVSVARLKLQPVLRAASALAPRHPWGHHVQHSLLSYACCRTHCAPATPCIPSFPVG